MLPVSNAKVTPMGCPCGCLSKPPYCDDWQCARHLPLSVESARAAWRHLNAHKLVDDEGFVGRVLTRAA